MTTTAFFSSLARIATDARFSLRLIRRNPAFGLTLLGVLAAGIGTTTAMFSLVVSLLLRPLPYANPEELTMIVATQPQVDPSPVSLPDFFDWKEQAKSFTSMTAVDLASMGVSRPGETPESLPGAHVSGDFFGMFGLSPLRGRLLGPDDDHLGGARVAVISASLWQRRFASDPGVIGSTLMLDAEPYTVVGIAPEGFRFSSPLSNRTEVWIPLAVGSPNYAGLSSQRDSHFLGVLGRRRTGVSATQAEAELVAIAKGISARFPDSNTNVGVRTVDLHDAIVGSARGGVWVLFIAVALVFLVVCANISNLLLARAAARRTEMAARAALGASTDRLVAQLLTETVTLFLLASVLGAGLAHLLVGIFKDGLVTAGALTVDVKIDGVAFAFAVLVSLACGLVFGLVPAFEAARVSPQEVLKASGTRASTAGGQRFVRGGLVIAQVALAFALLASSGVALRGFLAVENTALGFDPNDVATATLVLPSAKYGRSDNGPNDDRTLAFYKDLTARLEAEPGVVSVGANTSIPMGNSNSNGSFLIEGRPPWPAGARPLLERNTVTPGYFRTLGVPLLRGRLFTDADVKEGRKVLVLSQAAARKFFPNEDPIGQRIDWGESDGEPQWREIVGVVGDVHRFGRREPHAAESYAPVTQHHQRWLTFVVRTKRASSLLRAFPEIVARIDPEQAVADRRLMTERVAGALARQRFVTTLLGAFSVAALLLATLGIFGLVSYTTNQRTRELGIRIALGSSSRGILALVMREGLALLGLGLASGVLAAIALGRPIADRIAGATAFDPVVLATMLVVLGLAGALASLVPALRAIRIPPAIALRYE